MKTQVQTFAAIVDCVTLKRWITDHGYVRSIGDGFVPAGVDSRGIRNQ